ncbi:MAG: GNAT family N-acetyltransferase [Oscillospiraceae bacterium]|nr:GNAT family N-acetyltransferase [Oscillospiraceae bacterium]
MVLKRYNDVRAFYNDVFDVLMRHEAQNLIPLGNAIIGYEGKDKTGWRDPANWFMATVSDDAGVLLTALMTPPHNLTLYETNNQHDSAVIDCLIEGLSDFKADITVNGVMSENTLAESFARAYAAAKNVGYAVNKRQRIYELLEVNPDIAYVGSLRQAQESDMAFLPYWATGFTNDCNGTSLPILAEADYYRYLLSTGKLYILEDGGVPVSMARLHREIRTVCGIGGVYTPPFFRGRGYATSGVAALSRLALGRGFTKCVLYTDLANPTSNSIYQKIGYKPICDSLEIKFS